MAGHGRHRRCGVDGWLAEKVQTQLGFWLFLLSNVLWIVWGWHDHAYALITLQLGLAFLNIRGALKNTADAR
jgi:hypothetical protein